MYSRFWMLLLLGSAACQLYDVGPLGSSSPGLGMEPAPEQPDACVPASKTEEQCNNLDDDCDGLIDEASANASCAAEAAESVCVAGRCELVRCLGAARDCDGLAANGCEAELDSIEQCGACGRRCELTHARARCDHGTCAFDSCEPGYADCDGDLDTGCEVSLQSTDNCGGCGVRCADGEQCVGNVCRAVETDPPECTLSPYAGDLERSDECDDLCPQDPNKRAPGACGCGVPDVDSDEDGAVDCRDECPNGAWTTGPCLPFTPRNIDPSALDFTNATAAIFNCGVTTLDTTPETPVLSNSCGVTAQLSTQTQTNGASIVVMTVRDLTIASGSSLRLIGSRPLAIAVYGDASIEGTLDASADGATPGAGGNIACEGSTGGNGSGTSLFGGGGGGGGGFGTPGAPGGTGGAGARAGGAGAARGDESLERLLGGCGGGVDGGCSARAAGGGAVQLSASGRISVSGTIRANGANGARGCGSEGGGGGGGSGGAILLEARAIDARAQGLEANGGSGGNADGRGGAGSTAATLAGGAGQSHLLDGGGGGGGGYGRVRTVVH